MENIKNNFLAIILLILFLDQLVYELVVQNNLFCELYNH